MSINLWKKWKGLKHWQKSGIIVAIIGVLLWYDPIHSIFDRRPGNIPYHPLIELIILLLKSFLYSSIIVGTIISSIFINPIISILVYFNMFNKEDLREYVFINHILLTSIYFIIGAAFGQLYYEIRHPTSLFDGSRIKARILTLIILLMYIYGIVITFFLLMTGASLF